MSNVNFGSTVPGVRYDPRTISGFGHRPYNWEFSTSVQHEVVPRVSMDVGYFRRWYGNFTVTDNAAVAPSDYSTFSVPAPRDARLPDGGGYVIERSLRPEPEQGRAGGQLLHAGQRVRQADRALERRGRHSQRADAAAACCCRAA